MSDLTPRETAARDAAAVDEVASALAASTTRRVILATHIRMDGDGLGSAVALRRALELMGKSAEIAVLEPVPERYKIMPRLDRVVRLDQHPEITPSCDILVTTDCGEPKLLAGMPERLARPFQVLNIDHHVSNVGYGDVNCVITTTSSTAEVAHRIIRALGVAVDHEIAMGIYVGLVLDTGSFSLRSTTPEAHRIAAEMLEHGVDPNRVFKRLFRTKRLAYLRLAGEFQQRIRLTDCGRVAWGRVSMEMVQTTGVGDHELDDLIEVPRSLHGPSLAMVLREIDSGAATRVSLRSEGDIDVNDFLQAFGGGGHRRAAGCVIPMSLDEVEQVLVPKLVGLCDRAMLPTITEDQLFHEGDSAATSELEPDAP